MTHGTDTDRTLGRHSVSEGSVGVGAVNRVPPVANKGKNRERNAMDTAPSTNGSNGRNPNGTFAKGNSGGPGNPHAKRTAELRTAALHAVTAEDIQEIMAELVRLAKTGDIVAIREVFNRTIGKPTDALDPDRAAIEAARLHADWLRAQSDECTAQVAFPFS